MKSKAKMDKETSSKVRKSEKFYNDSEKYLEEIGFFKKLESFEDFSPEEIKQILIEVIQKYFNGECSQDFVSGVGSILHTNVITGSQISGTPKEVEKIAAATCTLDDLDLEIISSKKKRKSFQEIDSIIRNVWNELTEGTQNQ
jgi:hypothetical protein